MVDLDEILEPTVEEVKEREHARLIARMKAEIAYKQRERAMQGYYEIKPTDFN